jgi:hypothetical protein
VNVAAGNVVAGNGHGKPSPSSPAISAMDDPPQ